MFPENSHTLEVLNLAVHGGDMIFEEDSWTPEIRSRSGTNPAKKQYHLG